MIKSELRSQFLKARKALLPNEVKHRSQLITRRFFDYVEANRLADEPSLVHTFLPIRRQNEVDTWPIIDCFWEKFGHLTIVVPVADMKTGQMHHYALFPNTPLTENALGIPEPTVGDRPETNLTLLSVVIVPLLAFDRHGHRVGYGGGFYDRFLGECPPRCYKIGVSLFDPIDAIDDVTETDIKLDVCITPTQTWYFS